MSRDNHYLMDIKFLIDLRTKEISETENLNKIKKSVICCSIENGSPYAHQLIYKRLYSGRTFTQIPNVK